MTRITSKEMRNSNGGKTKTAYKKCSQCGREWTKDYNEYNVFAAYYAKNWVADQARACELADAKAILNGLY